MIFSIAIIIATSVGLGTGLIGGGAVGFAIAHRKRSEVEADEDYEKMIEYYSTPDKPHYETEQRNVFSRL